MVAVAVRLVVDPEARVRGGVEGWSGRAGVPTAAPGMQGGGRHGKGVRRTAQDGRIGQRDWPEPWARAEPRTVPSACFGLKKMRTVTFHVRCLVHDWASKPMPK